MSALSIKIIMFSLFVFLLGCKEKANPKVLQGKFDKETIEAFFNRHKKIDDVIAVYGNPRRNWDLEDNIKGAAFSMEPHEIMAVPEKGVIGFNVFYNSEGVVIRWVPSTVYTPKP